MCVTCGCGETEHHHHHDDHHTHQHHAHTISLEQDILAVNAQYAEQNRAFLKQHDTIALNFVSSPGSGKTTLLEKTIQHLTPQVPIAVIEGDQYTELDAQRIRKAGAQAYQINTGKACHLDAHMVGHAFDHLMLKDHGLVLIENVGNLICPALFDLGEHYRVAIMSVTEGADKPIKYADMFHGADVVIINKIDLLPYVDFDQARCIEDIRKIQPKARIIELSAKTETGFDQWLSWLKQCQTP